MPSFADYPSALPYFVELHNKDLLDELVAELKGRDCDIRSLQVKLKGQEEEEAPSHPFMEAFEGIANLSLTANGASTNASTNDPCLDLYYANNRAVGQKDKWSLYEKAWAMDPDLTLHIIFYTRSIHRGKSALVPFCDGFCWLLQHHPRTALANLHVLVDGTIRTSAALKAKLKEAKKKAEAEDEGWEVTDKEEEIELLERRDFKTHGYWKDLCTLLTIAAQGELDGPEMDEYKALHWPRLKRDKEAKATTRRARKDRYLLRKKMPETEAKDDRQAALRKCSELNAANKITAKENRMKICEERNEQVVSLLESNKTYRALHFTIAKLFADQLKVDMTQFQKNKAALEQGTLSGRHALGFNLSMAAKWAPSLYNSHDKHTFLATSIAEVLFPPESYQQSEESREHYLNKVRDLYRKQYLVPLRKAMDLTEHYMADGKWGKVDFSHIPAVCFEKSMSHFFSHDPESLMDYLDEVAKGTKQVSGETLAPNNLAYRAAKFDAPKNIEKILQKVPSAAARLAEAEKNLVNGQWNTLIQGLRETSQLDVTKSNNKKIDLGECIAICDVSGSMFWGFGAADQDCPYYVAIGLSLVITNLAKPPFNGALITFSAQPELAKIDTSLPFSDQVKQVMNIDAGYNTNLRAVFTDVLLPMAVKHNLKQEDMVKRLFIFTDMEFDSGTSEDDRFETTFDFIQRKYDEAGYELPEIVWWNLSGQNTCSGDNLNAPVTKHQEKTSLLSGFSASMLKTFLDGDADDIEEEKDQEVKDEEDKEDQEDKESNAKSNKKEQDPLSFAKKAVYHESFNGLVVID
ncbi:hypothetical protein G6F61_007648 [Rhizopus arrhizus]|nr:hypothetical protein G6F61_007648 [Rhizopus arrhizus]